MLTAHRDTTGRKLLFDSATLTGSEQPDVKEAVDDTSQASWGHRHHRHHPHRHHPHRHHPHRHHRHTPEPMVKKQEKAKKKSVEKVSKAEKKAKAKKELDEKKARDCLLVWLLLAKAAWCQELKEKTRVAKAREVAKKKAYHMNR